MHLSLISKARGFIITKVVHSRCGMWATLVVMSAQIRGSGWWVVQPKWVKVLNNAIYEFSSKTEILCFVGLFASLTKSKNYEIWRVARGLRDERPSFWIDQKGVRLTLFLLFQSLKSIYWIETINVFFLIDEYLFS
jgi:hypothetical protein